MTNDPNILYQFAKSIQELREQCKKDKGGCPGFWLQVQERSPFWAVRCYAEVAGVTVKWYHWIPVWGHRVLRDKVQHALDGECKSNKTTAF